MICVEKVVDSDLLIFSSYLSNMVQLFMAFEVDESAIDLDVFQFLEFSAFLFRSFLLHKVQNI